jgi:alanyl-tRNA synthetase
MPDMTVRELRERYQRFFEARGHRRIPSASLLPENDASVLFTTAGMHPLAPYLLGEPHPMGTRLVDVQRCIRTGDIDEVGDASHLTFFEMLGNWSLGDYFKRESLAWSYEFLTRELGLDHARLAVTVFAGDADAPRDDESAKIWRDLGIPADRIHFLPKEDNWWGPVGNAGPCGPDSEMFYNTGRPDHPGCRPGCVCGKWLEIWNNVFMAYHKTADGTLVKLSRANVDTGMGLDRTVAVINGYDDVYRIDTLAPLIARLEALSGYAYADPLRTRPLRIVADHIRAATVAIADGASPSNVEAGYIVRRLIRRAIRYGYDLGIRAEGFCAQLAETVLSIFGDAYPVLEQRRDVIMAELTREESRFKATLERGLHEYRKLVERLHRDGRTLIAGADAFNLYETFGFPLPLTLELAREEGLQVDEDGFSQMLEEHKADSRRGAEQKFKGGLVDHSEQTTRLHTATHLLHAALRQVLGTSVRQMGSNITPERLRFDFSYPDALSEAQLREVERLVNEEIARDDRVSYEVMPLAQATDSGALAFFNAKYGEQVKVYSIGTFSREVCGGPHAAYTGELGGFTVVKQEAVGQGVRRIRAVIRVQTPGISLADSGSLNAKG